jgi:hypothetical protein
VTRSRAIFGDFLQHIDCCEIRTLEEGGCKVVLPNRAGPWICLSGTKYQRRHSFDSKLADGLLSWQPPSAGLRSSAMELKGGGLDVDDVVSQLQHGADIIGELLGDRQCNFIPVLVHRAIRSAQVDEFRNRRVRFKTSSFRIALIKQRADVRSLPW